MKLPFVEKVRARKEAAREKKAKEQFKRLYIATHPIDFSNITEFRNDAFPESGPSCWLDRPNALMEIERKERDREITAAQAEMCTKWVLDGYYIAPGCYRLKSSNAPGAPTKQALTVAPGRLLPRAKT
jgi:hypothetical protein